MAKSPASVWRHPKSDFKYGKGRWVHPLDQGDVRLLLKRTKPKLNTFPSPFFGPLLSAPLVLCYASPGISKHRPDLDVKDAKRRNWINNRLRSLDGRTAIDFDGLHSDSRNWIIRQLKSLLDVSHDDAKKLGGKVAILELSAYRGVRTEWNEVGLLPTTNLTREWAKAVLFPEAIAKKRVVIVLRAAQWWALPPPPWSKGHLFVPLTTQGAHIISNKKKVTKKVAKKIETVARNARNEARRAAGL